jgi:hypothetical protein
LNRDPVVQVPADLDVEDRLVGPITFRAAGWLAVAGVGVGLLILARRQPVLAIPGMLLLAGGVLGAWWKPGGRPMLAWALPLLTYRRRRRRTSRDPISAPTQPKKAERRNDEPNQSVAPASDVPASEVTAEQSQPRKRPRIRSRDVALLVGACAVSAVALYLQPWTLTGGQGTGSQQHHSGSAATSPSPEPLTATTSPTATPSTHSVLPRTVAPPPVPTPARTPGPRITVLDPWWWLWEVDPDEDILDCFC